MLGGCFAERISVSSETKFECINWQITDNNYIFMEHFNFYEAIFSNIQAWFGSPGNLQLIYWTFVKNRNSFFSGKQKVWGWDHRQGHFPFNILFFLLLVWRFVWFTLYNIFIINLCSVQLPAKCQWQVSYKHCSFSALWRWWWWHLQTPIKDVKIPANTSNLTCSRFHLKSVFSYDRKRHWPLESHEVC